MLWRKVFYGNNTSTKLMAESSLQERGVEMLFRADSCILAAARGEPPQRKVIFQYNFSLLMTRLFTLYKTDTVHSVLLWVLYC